MRLPCINIINNYAISATRKYFIETMKIFEDHTLIDLYLYSNALSLGIRMTNDFLSARTVDSKQIGDHNKAIDINREYIKNTQDVRNII